MVRVDGIAGLVCGRWTKWMVLVFWLAILVVAVPLASKLTGVQQNDSSAFLPGTAEATEAGELQKAFQPAAVAPAVVVYERTGGITPADRTKVLADVQALARIDGVAGQVSPPVFADDGQAAQIVVPVRADASAWERLGDVVGTIRDTAASGGDGLNVEITGPAATAADAEGAFKGIDGTLLYTTLVIVAIILLVTYRSPVLWLLPIITSGVALISAQSVIYLLAKHADLVVNGQSAGILTVLVFGAGTDYALLLVARYREELRRHEDRHHAMALALHRAGPAIIGSAATVAIGMACLAVADMNSTRSLGPVAAIGIAVGLLTMISLLPALLVIFGRRLFWPVRPKFGSPESTRTGVWVRLGNAIARRPRTIWIATALALGALSLGALQLDANGLSTENSFIDKPQSVSGQEVLIRHFAAGESAPVVVIGRADAAGPLRQALAGTDGIVAVGEPTVKDGRVLLNGILRDRPDSAAAERAVERVRDTVHAVPGGEAKVGGVTALNLDLKAANRHDNRLIIPLVLLVVLIILMVLLRTVVAPLVLMATVVLSFGAALGISALIFRHVLGFAGADTSLPLYVFVFLVALGIDYNIFLMTRAREESQQHGARRGALLGLAATGGVITSAGIVLAGTFAALGSLPLAAFAELGIAVALGILLDTMIVRSVLVIALTLDIGRWMWWPSALMRRRDGDAVAVVEQERATDPAPA